MVKFRQSWFFFEIQWVHHGHHGSSALLPRKKLTRNPKKLKLPTPEIHLPNPAKPSSQFLLRGKFHVFFFPFFSQFQQDCHVLVDGCSLHDRLLRWDARSLFGGALDLDDHGGLLEPRGLWSGDSLPRRIKRVVSLKMGRGYPLVI